MAFEIMTAIVVLAVIWLNWRPLRALFGHGKPEDEGVNWYAGLDPVHGDGHLLETPLDTMIRKGQERMEEADAGSDRRGRRR